MNPEDRALILALARQESRFVPAALSRSFAIGAMQMMPFLIRAMAEDKGEKDVDLTEFFYPERIVPYAKDHLKWLRRRLDNPLFIAYAYNGGIGFTNREVVGKLFVTKGKYEPFLSMELVPYAER